MSILKPLCGLDDGLQQNLESFTTLAYDDYEVLLGVASLWDPAYPVARRLAELHPTRIRVEVQHGEPGLNPKVNQLITLAAQARGEVLVVSDSNVRVHADYLDSIASALDDESVGLVTHPIAGVGELTLGALLDNAHMSSIVGPGMVAAREVAGKWLVVGKSMAMRSSDLRAVGGFEAVKDVLAEDHVMGQLVEGTLDKRVAVAHSAVYSVVQTRSMLGFMARYARWGTIQHRSVGLIPYLGLALLNPIPFALLALCVAPRPLTLLCVLTCVLAKAELELCARRCLATSPPVLLTLVATVLKDVLVTLTWLHGLVRSEVVWRGHRLSVHDGTVLHLVGEDADPLSRPRSQSTDSPSDRSQASRPASSTLANNSAAIRPVA